MFFVPLSLTVLLVFGCYGADADTNKNSGNALNLIRRAGKEIEALQARLTDLLDDIDKYKSRVQGHFQGKERIADVEFEHEETNQLKDNAEPKAKPVTQEENKKEADGEKEIEREAMKEYYEELSAKAKHLSKAPSKRHARWQIKFG